MPKYYEISEVAAKRAKDMNSFSDYKPGSATSAYRQMVDEAYAIAERQKARSHSGRKPGVQLIAVQVCLGVALAKAKTVQLLTVQHLAGDIGFLDDKLVFQRAGQQA